MRKFNRQFPLFFVCFGLLNTASAAESENRAVIEQLVTCRAPLKTAVAFSTAVDSPDFDLASAEEFAPWGGVAWKVYPIINLGNTSSDIVIMKTNRSFYLRVPSKDPKADIRMVAKALQLTVETDRDDYLDYRKTLTDRTIQVQSTENADDFWVGCFYDLAAFKNMDETLLNATPARIKQKNEFNNKLKSE